MPAPYRWTLTLFAALAALAAFDAALVTLGLVDSHAGLLWLRIHLVTLGLFAEALFGLLPALTARGLGRPAPELQPGRWLMLTAGLATLLVGIPLVRQPMIALGGALILSATLWLIWELWSMRPAPALDAPGSSAPQRATRSGRRFHLTGLAFLLAGGLVGTGLWLGWSPSLGIAVPRETHIHAGIWGLASLLLAGLLVDLSPAAPTEDGSRSRWIDLSFWGIAIGALLLLIAPWVGIDWLMLPGILFYLVGTILLYRHAILPLRGQGAGARHLLTAYLWILLPALALPFIILGGPEIPVARVESVGPSILTYGWLLQALVALLPAAAERASADPGSDDRPLLGGTTFSWITCNLVPLLLVISVVLPDLASPARGLAYLMLALLLGWLARDLIGRFD